MVSKYIISLALLGLTSAVMAQPAATQLAATMPATTQATVEDPAARKINSLADIFTISITNGYLSVTTSLKPDDTPLRVSHPDLPGGGEVRQMMAVADDGSLRQFAFTTPPDGAPDVVVKTGVSAIASQVQLTHDAETVQTIYSVQYIQQLPLEPDSAEEPPVKLYVKLFDNTKNTATIDLRLAAANFEDLRQKHPINLQHVAPVAYLASA